MPTRFSLPLLCLLTLPLCAHAFEPAETPSLPPTQSGAKAARSADNGPRGTVIRPTPIYIDGSTKSEKLSTLAPGRELAIMTDPGDHSAHWLRVYANIDDETGRTQDQPLIPEHAPEQPISGWIEDKNVVSSDTPDGAAILFGEAIAAEQAASGPHPPPTAAAEARGLYRMAAVLYPNDPRVPEAMWRSADIRWQLEKEDAATLPSAHEKENYLRQHPDESEMKRIEKQFPGTKWASFAAYDLIDNKLCGDWQGSEDCPEKEATYYGGFAEQFPDSPRAPEALYETAWRLACAGDMWTSDSNDKRATEDRNRSVDTARHLAAKYPGTDWAARADALVFKVDHGVPVYGSDRE